jgi:hypothetical protein
MALMGLGGTWLHEMAHLLIGLFLWAKPVSFSIWPRRSGAHWVLGSVGFRNLNIFNSGPVAMAPLLLLGLGWFLVDYWMLKSLNAGDLVSWLFSGYAVACCLSACVPSTTDFKVGGISTILYLFLVYTCFQLFW